MSLTDVFFYNTHNNIIIYSYNHAVHVIRLRIHLLQKKLSTAEMRARSSSLYLCPGYASKTCNGRYNETEAQQIVDPESGLFLCRECVRAYTNHPNPPLKQTYTLKLLDNQKELKSAMDNMRRVRVQLSSKVDMESQPLRPGIFDLLQKVRAVTVSATAKGGGEPLSSNLPSENIAIGIGSKRIAGTGRTAGILAKKQQKLGLNADGTKIGGPGGFGHGGGGRRRADEDELTFLKNAIGQEIGFELEKGGGARANLLATKGRIRNKLVDAAAMKVGVDLGLVAKVIIEERERQKRKREEKKKEEEDEAADGNNKKKKMKPGQELFFLQDSLGLGGADVISKEEREKRRLGYLQGNDADSADEDDRKKKHESYYVSDETDELRNLPEGERRAAFQAQYKAEVQRQMKLLGVSSLDELVQRANVDGDDDGVEWEDG